MCAAFLWSGSPHVTTKARVAWADLCLPEQEGGLGIRRLRDTSIAYSLSLIWRLFTSPGSYWVAWTRHYLLRNSSFWDMKRNTRGSWIWNKLLKLRPLAQSFFKIRVGTGHNTYFWLDNWLGQGALIQLVGEVGPSIMGIARSAKVSDVTRHGSWRLCYHRNPIVREYVLQILALPAPQDSSHMDEVLWHHGSDVYHDSYSMKQTWNQLRHRGEVTDWSRLVWSPLSIPRYSFISWLAIQNKLPTGARMAGWGRLQTCPLCSHIDETRDHLFFNCPYSATIWTQLISRLLGDSITPVWTVFVPTLLRNNWPRPVNILIRLLFQASIYHVWRERNGRIHGSAHTPAVVISHTIQNLLTLRLKAQFRQPEVLHSHPLWLAWSTHA